LATTSDAFVYTGPDTLAGRYLRSFWQPIYRSQDLERGRVVAVRIMSEDFTLYRGEGGAAHLIASRCAHRGTRLSTGWVEGDCLRCLYHGWKYDASGQCVEQPGEDGGFAAKVRLASYPTEEYLGLIFACLGEGGAPPLRRYPDFERPFVFEVGTPEIWPCNYFNRMENDPAHVPFVHRESLSRVGKGDQMAPRTVTAEETEYGVRATMRSAGQPARYVHYIMPNMTQTRSQTRVEGSVADAQRLWADRLFWHVPIDDHSNATFIVDLTHLSGMEADAYRKRRRSVEPARVETLNAFGAAVLAGRRALREMPADMSTYKQFWIEDYTSLVGQGSIPDREHERLGRIDAHIILLRSVWLRELKALAAGEPLKEWRIVPGMADMNA